VTPPWATAAPGERLQFAECFVRTELARFLNMAPAEVDASLPITSLGLDSLQAIQLANRWETATYRPLDLVALLRGPTPAELAVTLADQLGLPPRSEPASEGRDDVISYGQAALWYLQQLAPESANYNLASAALVVGPLDPGALRRAVQGLVDRHAALRTNLVAIEGRPSPRVHPHADVVFVEEPCAAVDATTPAGVPPALRVKLAEEAQRPFDLARDALLRVFLFRLASERHVLLLVAHHAVADMWSLGVLYRELGLLYAAERTGALATLPPLPLEALDLARVQRDLIEGPAGQQLWAYWQDQLQGTLPPLDLPIARPRPPTQTFQGATYAFRLDPDLTRAIKRVGRQRGATLYATLLAAFQVVLGGCVCPVSPPS
jgi:aryl carrier-like protein